jgi:hypothetical protein
VTLLKLLCKNNYVGPVSVLWGLAFFVIFCK